MCSSDLQNVQIFTEEFRKQALSLGISLDSPEVVTKYIESLHSYIRHSLLMFEPTTIDLASVQAIHLENKGRNDKYDHSKKPPFKPSNGKFKGKGKGKEKKMKSTKKDKGEKPYCTHYKKEGHDDDHCWKLYPGKSQRDMVESVSKRR